jgi:hypothetical protein
MAREGEVGIDILSRRALARANARAGIWDGPLLLGRREEPT